MITETQLSYLMPFGRKRVPMFLPYINQALIDFQIDTFNQQTMFLAQLAHESGELRYVAELAPGAAYEGRRDLGNTEPGDGRKYKGHGLIQITGKDNHRLCAVYFRIPFNDIVDWLQTTKGAALSAGWFWHVHKNLNPIAAAGTEEAFKKVTKRINGGYNGLEDRLHYWARAKQIISPTPEGAFGGAGASGKF